MKPSPYVCARLTDGKIVPLRKDCDCVTHTGPHWLHVSDSYRESNLRLLDRGTKLALWGCAGEEIARLRELAREFEQRKIALLLTAEDVETIRASGEAVDTSRPGIKPQLRAAIRLCFNDARAEFGGGRTWRGYLALWEWCGFRDGGRAGEKHERFYAKHGPRAYYARINRVRVACGFEPVKVAA